MSRYRSHGLSPEWEAEVEALAEVQAGALGGILAPEELEDWTDHESDDMADVRAWTANTPMAPEESLLAVRGLRQLREERSGLEGDPEPKELLEVLLRAILGEERFKDWTNQLARVDEPVEESGGQGTPKAQE